MRQVLLGIVWTALIYTISGLLLQGSEPEEDVPELGLELRLNCSTGKTIDLRGATVVVYSWVLSGHCTFLGGILVAKWSYVVKERGGTVQIDTGTLHVQGTHFLGVRVHAFYSTLVLTDGYFSPAPRRPGTSMERLQDGGIWARGSNVSIHDCTFEDLNRWWGGAVLVLSSRLEVSDSEFKDLAAAYVGGAIYAEEGETYVKRCHFRELLAGRTVWDRATYPDEPATGSGGAIYIDGGMLIVEDSKFERTSAMARGGAIAIQGNTSWTTARIVNSDFEHTNTGLENAIIGCVLGRDPRLPKSQGFGGAISILNGDVEILHSRFDQAQARVGGGAIHVGIEDVMCTRLAKKNLPVSVAVRHCHFQWSWALTGGTVKQLGGHLLFLDNVINGSWAKPSGNQRLRRLSRAQVRRLWVPARLKKKKRPTPDGGAIWALVADVLVRDVSVFNVVARGNGGAIYQEGGNLTLERVRILGATAGSYGGAIHGSAYPPKGERSPIYLRAFDLDIRKTNVTCVQQPATACGGGCFAYRNSFTGTLAISGQSVFRECRVFGAGGGGGLIIKRVGTVSMSNSLIIDSSAATNRGGGMALHTVRDMKLGDVQLTGCKADKGGSLNMYKTNVSINRLQVRNSNARKGGAVFLSRDTEMYIQDSTFVNCKAKFSGAAFQAEKDGWIVGDNLQIIRVTAKNQGGGIFSLQSTVFLSRTNIERAYAGLSAVAIFASDSHIRITRSNLSAHNESSGNLWTMTKSYFVLQDVYIPSPLKGRFGVVEDTEVDIQGITARCEDGFEFGNETDTYKCTACGQRHGIVGVSRVGPDPQTCFRCPAHSQSKGTKGCLCSAQHILNNSLPGVYSAFGNSTCVSCEHANIQCLEDPWTQDSVPTLRCLGKDRTEGKCQQAWAANGYWREDDSLLPSVPCPYEKACKRSQQRTCQAGYSGPMCLVCDQGRYRQSPTAPCKPCKVHTVSLVLFYLVLAAIVVCLVVILLRFKKTRDLLSRLSDELEARTSYLRVKFKQVLFIMQAFTTLQDLDLDVDISLPQTQAVDDMVDEVIPYVNLDVFASRHITRCRLGLDPFSAYYLRLAQVIVLFILIGWLSQRLGVEKDWMFLVFYNLLLMSMVRGSINIFLCDQNVVHMTGKTYLLMEYSLHCSGLRYHLVCCVALITLAVWCFCIPLFLFWRMFHQRHLLNPRICAPTQPTDSSPELQVRAVFAHLSREYNEALQCYGLSTMLHLTVDSVRRKDVDTEGNRLRLSRKSRTATAEEVAHIQAVANGSTMMRLDSQKLLKMGLRAVAERRNPALKSFRNLYKNYHCERWYFEFISFAGRICYAFVSIVPTSSQCLAGLLLSALLLMLLILFLPFQRRSDNYVGAVCYLAMLGMYASMTVKKMPVLRATLTLACLAFPMLAFLWYVVKAYLLPSRAEIWTAEAADIIFEEEFSRRRLAPRVRRQQQGVELASLQRAGLVNLLECEEGEHEGEGHA